MTRFPNGHKFTLPPTKHLWDGSTRPWRKGEKEALYEKLAPVLDQARSGDTRFLRQKQQET